MRRVFADASYWVAVINKNDQWVEAARIARHECADAVLVTTEEALNALSGHGFYLRRMGVDAIFKVLDSPGVTVFEQSHKSFVQGLQLYAERLDKGFSLTDCISMQVMRDESIDEVLTNDHHFTQAGFVVLMQ